MSRASHLCPLALFALAGCGKDEPVGFPPNGPGGTSTTETLVTDAAGIPHRKGFVVEKLLDLQPTQHGSWISLSFDAQGKHLLAGPKKAPYAASSSPTTERSKAWKSSEAFPRRPRHPPRLRLPLPRQPPSGRTRPLPDERRRGLRSTGTHPTPRRDGRTRRPRRYPTEDGQGLYLLAGKDSPPPWPRSFSSPLLAADRPLPARRLSFRIVASA